MNYVNMENWRYMMLHIKRSFMLGFIAILLLASKGYAQTASQDTVVLSLDTILSRIDQNNIILKTYALKAEGYIHRGEAATSWMAPMVGVGTYMTPYPGAMTMSPDEKGSLMFQIEQAIPGKAKLNAKKRSIQALGEVEKATRGITLNDLKAQAKQLYYTWLISQKRIGLLEKNERIMETMKKVEELRYTYNQSELGGIYKVEGRIQENRNKIQQQKGEIAKIRAWLNSLMNQEGSQYFEIDSNYKPVLTLESSYDTSALANKRADIIRMEKSIEAMKLDMKAVELEKRPDLSIRFDHMSPLAKEGMPNSYSIMGMISIPIAPWSSKKYKSESKAIQYDIQAVESEKAALLQQSQGILYGLQYEIQSKEKQVEKIEEKVIPVLQKSFDAYFINYQENKLELPFVIEAWEALLVTQMDLLDEKLKTYELIINYEKELYQ